jgi:hypothetical protein
MIWVEDFFFRFSLISSQQFWWVEITDVGKKPSGKRLHSELENHHAINGKNSFWPRPYQLVKR